MDGPRLSICVAPFADLQRALLEGSGNKGAVEVPDQVRYLESYLRLREERAQTIVIESPYVDRHYLEEYSGYYATALRQPPPKTTRIHVFKSNFNQAELDAWLRVAATDGPASVEGKLQPDYLGFIVVRPIPAAPIGRTVLESYATSGTPSAALRVLKAARTRHRVHLCGLELVVCGVPFQQQDQAVGACATTAIWSALACVMRADGSRPVTPLAVTTAATRRLETERAFPAISGLTTSQMLDAIREFGYSPHMFEPGTGDATERAVFQLALKCYLLSGIPVILELHYDDPFQKHAITVVGFRTGKRSGEEPPAQPAAAPEPAEAAEPVAPRTPPEGDVSGRLERLEERVTALEGARKTASARADDAHEDPDPDLEYAEELHFKTKQTSFGVRSAGIARLYGHDDRLGPYARMVWIPTQDSLPRVRFAPKEKGFEQYTKAATIYNAIVPLYPKLRLTASNMVEVAAELLPLMRAVAGADWRDEITLDLRYVLSGQYLRELLIGGEVPAARLAHFASTAVLSRYVGILHFRIKNFMFVDVICDPTDLLRNVPMWAPVIAMLPASDAHLDALRVHCSREAPKVLVV